ncbi:MAG TPA: carbonic anhydrase [Candidatus Limnocylindrales bacterium]
MTDRRRLLSAALAAAGAGLGLPGAAQAAASGHRPHRPDEALAALMEGNRRWVTGRLTARDPVQDRRRRVADGQHPSAVVFSCIDSRVPPEYVFDQDLGDIFVVRTAAQALDPLVGGAVEYGPVHGTPLVMVLGHTRCGAITATVESIEDGVTLPGHLADVVRALTPAYRAAKRRFRPDWNRARRVEATVLAQVHLTVGQLRDDPVLRPLIGKGKLAVVGGIYSLDTGAVHPL